MTAPAITTTPYGTPREDMEIVTVFGRCPIKGCKHRHVTKAPAFRKPVLDICKRVIDTYLSPAIKHPGLPDDGWWDFVQVMSPGYGVWPKGTPDDRHRCPEHKGLLDWRALNAKTVKETKVCDGRCRSATGPNCDCPCKGEQHGADVWVC